MDKYELSRFMIEFFLYFSGLPSEEVTIDKSFDFLDEWYDKRFNNCQVKSEEKCVL